MAPGEDRENVTGAEPGCPGHIGAGTGVLQYTQRALPPQRITLPRDAASSPFWTTFFRMNTEAIIGVIGGMGPHAGLDLVHKIFDQTDACTDHAHVPVALLSFPEQIPDRGAFLFGRTDVNPADAIVDIVRRLETIGVLVAGIPCNTAHAPPIFDAVVTALRDGGRSRSVAPTARPRRRR